MQFSSNVSLKGPKSNKSSQVRQIDESICMIPMEKNKYSQLGDGSSMLSGSTS